MGRDYWYGTGKGVRGGGGDGRSGGDSSGDPTVATGCMSSVFRFFDFHHFQLCYHLNHQQQHGNAADHFDSLSSTSQTLKGLEAPRNSFESLDALQADSASSISKPLSENITIPQMSVKTKRRPMKTNSLLSSEALSEDGLSSPGSRTPSLVARLMGLDLLPEASSPATSASSTRLQTQLAGKQMKNSCTQSLPDSPRISLTRWSDVDLHHRLSLQVNNKEGNGEDEVLCKRREMIKSLVQNSEAEGWSPGHYAKQMVKEGVGRSRRVGLTEITNTARGRGATQERRDEHLLPGVKIKPPSSLSLTSLSSKESQKTTARFRSEDDAENQPPITSSNTKKHLPVSPSTGTTIPTKVKSCSRKPNIANEKTASKPKCKKAVEDKFKFTTSSTSASAATASSKNKKEREPLFIGPPSPSSTANQQRNKRPLMSKKTPISTEQFNITSTTTTRTGFRRIKQVVVVSDKQNGQQLQTNFIEAKTQTVGGHEIQYVSKILKCMGIGNHTRVSAITNWFSPSHPLNPSIFHLLEPISPSTNLIIPKCNRLLIFQLIDEILADILQPSMCIQVMHMNGEHLVKLLTSKMDSFPLSNCQVLQDVDALVGSDYERVGSHEDEKGSVVREVEREILDCLLVETTALL